MPASREIRESESFLLGPENLPSFLEMILLLLSLLLDLSIS